MAYTVTAFTFNPPGPGFSLTNHEKAIWPKTYGNTAKIEDYPDKHEMLGLEFYIDHKLYEGHGTHWNAKYYNNVTDQLIFESDFDIPNPSTGGWTYWNWYRIFSWIGHCSWEISGPMNIRVEVTITSNVWAKSTYKFLFTVTTDSPDPDACVWNWDNIPGSVMCYVFSAIDSLFGWTKGSFEKLIGDVWDLVTNFFGDIYDFFTNIIGDAWDDITKFFGDIADFVTDAFGDFVDWILDVGGDIAGFVGDQISGALDWVTDQFTDFTDWLGEIGGSVADYIGGAIGDFVDWSQDQLGGIWEGVSGFFTDAIWGFVDAFWNGVDTGIEQAKHSPLHSDEPVRNPALKGLRKVVREHRKKYNRDEITGEKKNGTI